MMRASLLVMLVTVLYGCGERIERFGGPTMGSTYSIQYVPNAQTPDARQVKAEVELILEALDKQFSNWRADSVVSRFNALPAGACQAVPEEMQHLLVYGVSLFRESGGAFDLTVLPLMNLWGFGPQSRGRQVPDASTLAREQARVGLQHLHLDGETLCKDVAAQLDFDSMLAGHAVDRVGDRLAALGIQAYLVEITGELKGVGRKPDGSPWRIALEVPSGEGEQQVERAIALDGYGVATAGDYRNYFEEGGQRYSHTFDPRVGRPVKHALAAVSVVDPSVLRADALDTLLMVLGPEEGYAFAERHEIAAYFIMHQGLGFAARATSRFETLFPTQGTPRP
ncbi:FAD:protein FMN transferase [Pseudomonas inefficax]|jgi:thiamine biosynthesis lipoprotein|uniref:FAD:protein FMN transferase n=1 Tax=Pseudomonas TaxID=286 RepID=UPI000DD41EA3|nr:MULTISPECIES: FAD:protein FMN transferase [Pseudomonas]MBT9238194.1 FAD:protein FMN transferase [Pseudomonas sp. MG-2]WNN39809.1 FAD:protein FMN transferase [Pseudomonas inefficax]